MHEPRLAVSLLCLFAAFVAQASDRAVLTTLPSGTEPERIIGAVKQALVSNGWRIDQEGPTTVVARFVQSTIRARMRIVLVDGQVLVYEDIAERQRVGTPSQSQSAIPITAVPPEWIDDLRHDIFAALSMPELKLPAWSER